MSSKDRTDLAEERTDFAEDRTPLASERTFAGWARIAMASIGIGLGFNALFKMVDQIWVPKVIASAFIALAIFIIIAAERRARLLGFIASGQSIGRHQPENHRNCHQYGRTPSDRGNMDFDVT